MQATWPGALPCTSSCDQPSAPAPRRVSHCSKARSRRLCHHGPRCMLPAHCASCKKLLPPTLCGEASRPAARLAVIGKFEVLCQPASVLRSMVTQTSSAAVHLSMRVLTPDDNSLAQSHASQVTQNAVSGYRTCANLAPRSALRFTAFNPTM